MKTIIKKVSLVDFLSNSVIMAPIFGCSREFYCMRTMEHFQP